MAVPRNRMSNARKNSRRAHHAKSPKALTACPSCKVLKLPHCICPGCGHYARRAMMQPAAHEPRNG